MFDPYVWSACMLNVYGDILACNRGARQLSSMCYLEHMRRESVKIEALYTMRPMRDGRLVLECFDHMVVVLYRRRHMVRVILASKT